MEELSEGKRVLIVDDEEHIVQMLDINVRTQGYKSICTYNGKEALEAARHEHPDVILLDVMMPEIDGIEVCRQLKSNPSTWHIPVIMVSAKSEEQDKINGLEGGADDYITKPFNFQELFLRIRAALRQVELLSRSQQTMFHVGSVELDTRKYKVSSNGKKLDLTLTEFRILHLLIQQSNQVVSRDKLVREVFDREPNEIGRTVDVHVRNLRKKLEQVQTEGCTIETVRGVGYAVKEQQTEL